MLKYADRFRARVAGAVLALVCVNAYAASPQTLTHPPACSHTHAPTQPPTARTVVTPEADPLATAQQAMMDERYEKAVSILRAVLEKVGRNSARGRDASAMLVEALRVSGRYHEALSENEKLSTVLAQSQLEGVPGVADLLEDAARNVALLKPEVAQSGALDNAVASAPAGYLRTFAAAERSAFHDDRDAALAGYVKAVTDALSSGTLRDQDMPVLVGAAGKAIARGTKRPEVQRMMAAAEQCALNGDATVAQRMLGARIVCRLSNDAGNWKVLNRVAHVTSSVGESAALHRYAARGAQELALRLAQAFVTAADNSVNAHDFSHITTTLSPLTAITAAFPDDPGPIGDLEKRAEDIRVMLPIYRRAQETVQEELSGNSARASDDYERLADACARIQSERLAAPLARMRREAQRSAKLMRVKAAMSEDASSSCRFLGLDQTIGSDWSRSVGAEGWILFGMHDKDLAGGPRILDGTFRYAPVNPDSANAVRRWRDPKGYQSRPSDVPLMDPSAGTSETPISFIDDNGEEYPYAAGPDLEVHLSIPAGKHILSMPLHFSNPALTDSQYDVMLLSGDADPVCLASTVVSVPQAPSTLRARISGPGDYTLVVRRTNSLNANIPALFLDPDPSAEHPPLTGEFSGDALAAADIDVLTTGEGPAVTTVTRATSGSLGLLQKLVDAYKGATAEQSPQLAFTASTLTSASDLTGAQRELAGYLCWRFRERVPLEAGDALPAFVNYAAARYGAKSSEDRPAAIASLADRAGKLRKSGQIRYAEALDDMAWDLRIRTALSSGTTSGSASAALVPVAADLWSAVAAHYLDYHDVMLTTGESEPHPRTISLALDPVYAAVKARALTAAIAAGNLRLALSSPPDAATMHAPTPDQTEAAQTWIDTLGGSLGMSVNGLRQTASRVSAKSSQPAALIVYAAACAPLLGGSSVAAAPAPPALVHDPAMPETLPALSHSIAPVTPQPCLLRADQLETLARAYLGREMFTTDLNAFSAELSARALETLGSQYPDYARNAVVAPLLASLRPGSQPAAPSTNAGKPAQ